jgi:heat shock protein HslJ
MLSGTRATVQTSPTGVGGYSGCNWYGLRRDSASALVEMTARGCRDDIQDQDQRLTNALTRASSAVHQGDTLTLLDGGGSALVLLLRRKPTPATGAELPGTSWRLTSTTMAEIGADSVTLRFTADSVAGFAGCRGLSGTYVTTDDRLRFTYISMQPEECANSAARRSEEHLTTALSEMEHFQLLGGVLELTTFGGDTLRFSPTRRR